MRLVIPQLFATALLLTSATAQNVDFNRDVRPILSEYCFACHGPDAEARKGDLRLDLEEEAKKDFGGYFALVAQRPDESEIWLRVDTDDPDEVMPPPKAKKPLSEAQKVTLKRWIEQGANYAKHWAYVKPEKSPPTKLGTAPGFPIRNAIDGYVLNQLTELGMKPSSEASPNQLMRRVSLDLTGLPPSPDELRAFLAAWEQDSEKAYHALVDRLLKSPRFGEKWARPWLDLARYADSNGFQADQLRDSWAYRDWVIDALNANMPYDQFTIEQLAGDLLPNATLDQKIATGFHRTVTCNVEAGVHPEANRVDQVVDRVNTTGTVWLGATMECAQCHDHKYDPFTMKDYYSMFAYFNQTPVEVRNPSGKGVSFDFYGPKMDLPMSKEAEAQRSALQIELAALESQRKPIAKEANSSRQSWEKALRERIAKEPTWETLKIETFKGSAGEGFKPLDDGSILVTGKVPDKSSYTVFATGDHEEVGAIRLEVLADESLPSNGPARGNGSRPNIVLTEFRLLDADGKEIGLSGGVADYSQPNFDPDLAIDGDNQPRSAWAINPQFGKDHWIAFKTGQSIDARKGVKVEIDQFYGGSRVIGRLRLAVLKGEPLPISIPENISKIIRKEANKRTAKEKKSLDEYFLDDNPELAELNRQIAAVKRKLTNIEPDTTLVMVEQEEMRETRIMKRGNYLSPAETVQMDTPAILHPLNPKLPKNRLGFAHWLVDVENPLVARVAANRWWNEIFGHGIVATLEDFGTQSEPPTHPKLLDWLAVEFMENGWDMKHVLRQIVTSSTYRQDSRLRPELKQSDPSNHFYARGPRFRMSAEEIRDHGLAASGLLSTKMGGEPIMPYQPPGMWRQVGRNEPKWIAAMDEDRFRRGIYIVYRRAAPYPSFVSFDATDRGACTVKRGRTNTPLQALTLLNDPAYVEMALGLADRILTESPGSNDQSRINYAFQLVLQRPASNEEILHLKTLLDRKKAGLTPETATQLFAEPSKVVQPNFKGQPSELAAWFYVANVLLNLDEAISKG